MKVASLGPKKQLMREIRQDKRLIGVIGLVVVLPVIIAAVFLVQRYFTRAVVPDTTPIYVHTQRLSTTTGKVSFDTNVAVKAEITCSTERDGEYFACGADEESKTRHAITTNILLNPDTSYYVNIIIGDYETPAFIPAHVEGAAFGADFGTFESGAVGSCVGDKEYDAALDFNQDGCVNLNDAAETL